MKNGKYQYYTDAGHGWLAVKRKELEALDLLKLISAYSYQRGGTVYLEEDCDMGRFFDAKGWKTWADADEHIVSKYVGARSPIRSYERYYEV